MSNKITNLEPGDMITSDVLEDVELHNDVLQVEGRDWKMTKQNNVNINK